VRNGVEKSMRNLLVATWMMAAVCAQAATTAEVKTPIHGLTSMGKIGADVVNDQAELFAHPGVYRGSTINEPWRTLEPKEGKFDFSSIDEGLRALAKYNSLYKKTPAVAKIRVWSGTGAPDWLMKRTGGPYHVMGGHGPIDIGGYWTAEYKKQWTALQTALAEKYDANPLVGEVGASSCSTMTDEAFIFPHDQVSQKKMRENGFSDDAERTCLLTMMTDYDAWKLTPVDETFGPFISSDTTPHVLDLSFSLKVMQVWREHFGGRGVISNHSVQDPITKGLQPIFEQLKEVGQPIEIQTASQGVIQSGKVINGQPGGARDKSLPPLMDWNKVIQNALDYDANEIEIWNTVEGGGQAKISYEMLKAWAKVLGARPEAR